MSTLSDILETKSPVIRTIASTATVYEAVDKLCRYHVGALLVTDANLPIGMLSERDVMARVLLTQGEPLLTRVASVMTKGVVSIDINATPESAMALMRDRHFSHLPVTEEGNVVGILSIGDLIRWMSKQQDCELRALREYVSGPVSDSA